MVVLADERDIAASLLEQFLEPVLERAGLKIQVRAMDASLGSRARIRRRRRARGRTGRGPLQCGQEGVVLAYAVPDQFSHRLQQHVHPLERGELAEETETIAMCAGRGIGRSRWRGASVLLDDDLLGRDAPV